MPLGYITVIDIEKVLKELVAKGQELGQELDKELELVFQTDFLENPHSADFLSNLKEVLSDNKKALDELDVIKKDLLENNEFLQEEGNVSTEILFEGVQNGSISLDELSVILDAKDKFQELSVSSDLLSNLFRSLEKSKQGKSIFNYTQKEDVDNCGCVSCSLSRQLGVTHD